MWLQDSTAGDSSDDDGSDWILYLGIALIVAVLGGLLVVRFARRGSDGLDAIQAIGKTDIGLPQTTASVQTETTPAYVAEATNNAYIPAASLPAASLPAASLPDLLNSTLRLTRSPPSPLLRKRWTTVPSTP